MPLIFQLRMFQVYSPGKETDMSAKKHSPERETSCTLNEVPRRQKWWHGKKSHTTVPWTETRYTGRKRNIVILFSLNIYHTHNHMSSKRNILVWKETQGGKEHRGRAWFHLFSFLHRRIRCHHSPGKEKKHKVEKGTQSTKRNRYIWKETQDVAFLRSYYVLYLHVFFDIACFFFHMDVFIVLVWSRRCCSSPMSDLIQACFFWPVNVT